jgi:hypothetical protein
LGCLKGIDQRAAPAEEVFMRQLVLALLAVSGLAMTGIAPAAAVGTHHPFCLQGDDYPGLSNCTFDSYPQCEASASGRLLSCLANPYFNPGGDPRAYQNRRRVRSVYPAY